MYAVVMIYYSSSLFLWQLKLVEDESDARFEQVKMDSLRLAEVWESEKRRLQDEVSRQRDLVEVERENSVRVREQMST